MQLPSVDTENHKNVNHVIIVTFSPLRAGDSIEDNDITKQSVTEVKIRRSLVVKDMVDAFKNPLLLHGPIQLKPINNKGEVEEADDFGGVFRDILSAFWNDVLKGHATGESYGMVPCIRHDFSSEEWCSVARIIVKGYKEVEYFPVRLNKAFVAKALFGEEVLSADALLESFLMYIPTEDKSVIEKAMEEEDISDIDDVTEILTTLSSKRIPSNGSDLKKLVVELAHKEIVQAPSYIKEAWETVFSSFKLVDSYYILTSIYDNSKPTTRKVLLLFKKNDMSDNARESFDYLKRFIRALRQEDLTKFLRYCTGADIICVNEIKLLFTNSRGLERRFVAHTCGPTLEVPTTYECYAEFKEEFLNIIKSGYWNMDFA